MAANDYHVIVYQILAYLYACLKDGVDIDLASIEQFKEKTIRRFTGRSYDRRQVRRKVYKRFHDYTNGD